MTLSQNIQRYDILIVDNKFTTLIVIEHCPLDTANVFDVLYNIR